MKKIKKAAVLVPAFATVVLATVGSVTGTMAWFTANRTATSQASIFQATAMSTSLTVTATKGTGTAQVDKKGQDISVDGKLTHGSFDAVSEELSVAKYGSSDVIGSDGSITAKEAYTNISTLGTYENKARDRNWAAGSDTDGKIWYAVTWTYTMEYTFGGNTHDHALFIDLASSVFGDSVSGGKTKDGLRIAIYNANIKRIIGGDDTAASDRAPKSGSTYSGGYYLSNDGTANGSTNTTIAADGTYLTGLGTYATAVDTASPTAPVYAKIHDTKVPEASDFLPIASYTSRTDYLGTFGTAVKDKASLVFNVVAWFEGNDSSIVNANTSSELSSKVSAALKFYVNEVQPA